MKKILGVIVLLLISGFLFFNSDRGSFFICDHFYSLEGDPGIKAICYQKIGLETKDVRVCNKINDKTVGSEFDNKRSSCVTGVANSMSDPSICNSIDGVMKDRCIGISNLVNNDPKVCELINDGLFKDECYSEVGKSRNDIAFCNKIVDVSPGHDLQAHCIYSIAKNLNNKSICNLIRKEDNRKYCLESF